MHAIAGDQHVAFGRRQNRAIGRHESRDDAATGLFDADTTVAEDDVVLADPPLYRAE
jgi:hypothetical protein